MRPHSNKSAQSQCKTLSTTRCILAWITELTRIALQSYERRGLVLELRYAPQAAEQVHEMVRKEKECCAFLTFALHEDDREVQLTITAPDDAKEAADFLFQQFIASAEQKLPCPKGKEASLT